MLDHKNVPNLDGINHASMVLHFDSHRSRINLFRLTEVDRNCHGLGNHNCGRDKTRQHHQNYWKNIHNIPLRNMCELG